MKFLKKKNKTNLSALAVSKYVRTSPIKIRRILDQLIGRPVYEASFLLEFIPNRACLYISNVLKAAISHAKFKYGETSYSFFISRAIANEGTSLKRFQPRSQGRAFPIKKRFSHILIFSEIIYNLHLSNKFNYLIAMSCYEVFVLKFTFTYMFLFI